MAQKRIRERMKRFEMHLPADIRNVLIVLHAAGLEAYVVGGSVRDAVMGLVPHDFDVTTGALPEQTKQLFLAKGRKVIETGMKHGTLTVLYGTDPIEITTFRIDGTYADARHPEHVSFTKNLSEDLRRRDFTVNALAYAPETGLIDVFDGLADIERKILRCIGNPRERFSEDALRILRALRFSAKLDFSIEPETARAAIELRGLLERISAERITSELEKMFETGYPNRLAAILADFRPILSQIFPEIRQVSAEPYKALCCLTAKLPTGNKQANCANLRFAYFIAASGIGDAMLKRLRVPNVFSARVRALTEILPYAAQTGDRIAMRRLLSRFGENTCRDAAAICSASGENPKFSVLLEKCLTDGDCVSVASLAADGKDLAALGLKGVAIGKALNAALQAVMEEKITNSRSELLEYMKEHCC